MARLAGAMQAAVMAGSMRPAAARLGTSSAEMPNTYPLELERRDVAGRSTFLTSFHSPSPNASTVWIIAKNEHVLVALEPEARRRRS